MPEGTTHEIKRQWASCFRSHWSSMMINGSENMEVIGALLVKLCLPASASLPTLSWCCSLVFLFFLFRLVHVRTAVGTACGTKKKQKCAHFGTTVNEKEPDVQKLNYQIAHTKILYIRTQYEDIFIFQPSKRDGRKRTCLYVFSFCPPNQIIVSIMYVYYIRTFRE